MRDSFIPEIWYKSAIWIGLMALLSYIFFDLLIFELFYPYRRETLVYPFELLTSLGDSAWYIIGSILLYLLFRRCAPILSKASLFLLSSVLLSGLLVNIVKVIFGRARPQIYADEHLYGFFWFELDVLYRSFPSGHAATAMGVWLAFALFFPKYRLRLIGLGIAVSLSRVVLSQHYLSDVLIGGWIGAMTTLVLYGLFYPKGSYAKS